MPARKRKRTFSSTRKRLRFLGYNLLGFPLVILIQLMAGALSLLPVSASARVGDALGFLLDRIFRFRRGLVQDAMEQSFPEKAPGEQDRMRGALYRHAGRTVVELLCMSTARGLRRCLEQVEVENPGVIDAARAQGRGVLVLSCHSGNWELAGAVVVRLGIRVTVIVKEIKGRAVDAWWLRTRRRLGMQPVRTRESFRNCLAALKRNEMVVCMLDQNMTRPEGIFVEFFGRPACTSPGLAYLAAVSGAPVISIFMTRREDGHLLRVGNPLPAPEDRGDEAIRRATQEYTQVIENHIRAYPAQWMWFHKRWRTRPE